MSIYKVLRDELYNMTNEVSGFELRLNKLKKCPEVVRKSQISLFSLAMEYNLNVFIDESYLDRKITFEEIVELLEVLFRFHFTSMRDFNEDEQKIVKRYKLSDDIHSVFAYDSPFYNLLFLAENLNSIAGELLSLCRKFQRGLVQSQRKYITWYYSFEGPGYTKALERWKSR